MIINSKQTQVKLITSEDPFLQDPAKLYSNFEWLSPHTFDELFLRGKTPQEMRDESLFSVWGYDDNNGGLVSGSLVYKGYDVDKKIWHKWEEKPIAELGSNFVTLGYRGLHLAKQSVLERKKYVERQNFFPVAVVGDSGMQGILESCGAIPIEKLNGKYSLLRSLLRNCNCNFFQKENCKACLLTGKGIYIFP